MKRQWFLVSIFGVMSWGSLLSQTQVQDTTYWTGFDLGEVVITGTRVPKLLKESPVQTRLVSAKDIQRTSATNIEELLQAEMPGVEFSYAMNQQLHLNFGGFGGQSVLFLIDGERLSGETMDDVDFSRIDMSNVERIEIVRGASAALYGSSAGGGVINIITKEASKKIDLNLEARFGKHADRRYVFGLGNRLGKFRNHLSVTASRINSFDVQSADNPSTRVVSTVYGHKTLNAKEQLTYLPLPNLKLTTKIGFYMQEVPREEDAPDRYRSYTAGLRGEWEISKNDKIEISYAFDQYDKSQYRRLVGLDVRHYSNAQNSVRALYHHSLNKGDVLSIGSDYRHDYLFNSRLVNGSCYQDNADVFAQYDWIINKQWEVVTAARYDYFSEGNLSCFTPKISARYAPLNHLNFRASYGMGFRAPTLKEKYYEFDMAGIWVVKGNELLKPESGHNLNLSADYTHGRYNLTATAYYNYVENRITTGLPYYIAETGKQLYLDYINLDHFHILGAELTAQAAWHCGLSAKISYACTYEHLLRDKAGNAANNPYMPTRPHAITARMDWHKVFSSKYTLDIGLNGRFLSSVTNEEYKDYYHLSEGTAAIKYPAYTLWKLSVEQLFFGKVKLMIMLDNLFNYRPKYYYLNAPLTDGINVFVGLNFHI